MPLSTESLRDALVLNMQGRPELGTRGDAAGLAALEALCEAIAECVVDALQDEAEVAPGTLSANTDTGVITGKGAIL